jgi:hypothetical protein
MRAHDSPFCPDCWRLKIHGYTKQFVLSIHCEFKEKGGGEHGYRWMPVWLTAEEIIQHGSIYNVLL